MGKRFFVRLLLCLPLLVLLPQRAFSIGKMPPNAPLYDNKLFHFGFSLGMNFMDFSVKSKENLVPDYSPDSSILTRHRAHPGFTVGVVTNLRMGKYFDLRFIPSFSMGYRSLEFAKGDEDISKVTESIMILLPLEVKWKAARINNHRPYVTAGFQYTADMANRKYTSRKGQKNDQNNDSSGSSGVGEKVDIILLKPNDIGVTVGVGWDFFLPFDNKLSVELKAYFGFMNVLNRKDIQKYSKKNYELLRQVNQIERLNSRMIQLSVTFE